MPNVVPVLCHAPRAQPRTGSVRIATAVVLLSGICDDPCLFFSMHAKFPKFPQPHDFAIYCLSRILIGNLGLIVPVKSAADEGELLIETYIFLNLFVKIRNALAYSSFRPYSPQNNIL